MNINKLRGQQPSVSMPSFRFNAQEDDMVEVEPEPEEVFPEQEENSPKNKETTESNSSDNAPSPKNSSQNSSQTRSTSLDSPDSAPGPNDSDSKSLFSGIKESVRDRIVKTVKNLEDIGVEFPVSVKETFDGESKEKSKDSKCDIEKSSHVLTSEKFLKNGVDKTVKFEKTSIIDDPSQTFAYRRKLSKSSNAGSPVKVLDTLADEGEELTEDWELVDLVSSKPQTLEDVPKQSDVGEEAKATKMDLYHRYYKDYPKLTKNLVLFMVTIFVYVLSPISSFVSGCVIGVILTATIGPTIQWLLFPPKSCQPDWVKKLNTVYSKSEVKIKSADEKEDAPEKFSKVWMNLLPVSYSPETYHINQTKSVFIRLEGHTLRISWPQSGISKRAMWNEAAKHDPMFVKQRYIDLTSAQISLKPQGLARKRLWSKKYPICVILSNEVENSHIEGSDDNIICLFARTCREKEEWFRRFKTAATVVTPDEITVEEESILKHRRSSSNESCHSIKHTSQLTIQDFHSHILALSSISPDSSKSTSVANDKLKKPTQQSKRSLAEELPLYDVVWMNAFIGRVLWDFLIEESWSKIVADKIQKKLSKIRVPYIMEELSLTEIELGSSLPIINKVTKPYLNDQGLWCHFDVVYSGSFCMTLETKLNLMRLKRSNPNSDDNPDDVKVPESHELDHVAREEQNSSLRSQLYDSDAEDSAESSGDEDSPTLSDTFTDDSLQNLTQQPSASASKKLLRIVDKIAQSKYFQQATDIKYVKRKMEEVSNTRLLLTVEVHNLAGVLAVNIPPPPTDRIWYGFHGNPKLWISARPKLGERQVTMSHITDWIEKKLAIEFQRILVMPNMDDLIIPVMNAKLR